MAHGLCDERFRPAAPKQALLPARRERAQREGAPLSVEAGARTARIVAFGAALELATATALLVDPALVVDLLVGAAADSTARVASRCFGIALLALAVACWPAPGTPAPRVRPALLVFNVLIALYLGTVGVAGQAAGVLLWPAAALHALVALLLAASSLERRGARG